MWGNLPGGQRGIFFFGSVVLPDQQGGFFMDPLTTGYLYSRLVCVCGGGGHDGVWDVASPFQTLIRPFPCVMLVGVLQGQQG